MSIADLIEFPTPNDAALDRVQSAVVEIQSLGTISLSPSEFDRFLVGLLTTAEQLSAALAETISDADDRAHHTRFGFGSLNAHLAGRTHQPTKAIAPKRTLGCWATRFPLFLDAWKKGVLSEAQVRELRKLDNRRTHFDLQRDQHVHIESAQTLEFGPWCDSLQYWMLHADPNGQLPDHREQSYGLTLHTKANGDVEVKGTLDPISGDSLKTAIEFQSEKLFRSESADDGGVKKTERQRNLEALMALIVKGHAREDGSEPTPLINIVMSEPVAEALLEKACDPNAPPLDTIDLDHGNIDRRCETLRGTPLDPRRCLPLVLIGKLRRHVMGAKTREVSQDVRLFPQWMRNALLVESRGTCATWGCDAPLGWLQGDHIHPTSKGGGTSVANGQPLCGPDNKRKRDRL